MDEFAVSTQAGLLSTVCFEVTLSCILYIRMGSQGQGSGLSRDWAVGWVA